jgi:hypothetical protein
MDLGSMYHLRENKRTAMQMYAELRRGSGEIFREKRIAEEFAIARGAGFHGYGTAKTQISGAASDLWHLWICSWTFPSDYLFVDPVFRFLVKPPVKDVNECGRVIVTRLKYVPGMRVHCVFDGN